MHRKRRRRRRRRSIQRKWTFAEGRPPSTQIVWSLSSGRREWARCSGTTRPCRIVRVCVGGGTRARKGTTIKPQKGQMLFIHVGLNSNPTEQIHEDCNCLSHATCVLFRVCCQPTLLQLCATNWALCSLPRVSTLASTNCRSTNRWLLSW